MINEHIIFRAIAKNVLYSKQVAFSFFHSCDEDFLKENLKEKEDILLLRKMMEEDICRLSAFKLLLQIDKKIAEEFLFDFFLGEYCPDSMGNGYEYELSSMLDNYHDFFGSDGLKELLCRNEIPLVRLQDWRVSSALKIPLDFEDNNESLEWLKTHIFIQKEKA